MDTRTHRGVRHALTSTTRSLGGILVQRQFGVSDHVLCWNLRNAHAVLRLSDTLIVPM